MADFWWEDPYSYRILDDVEVVKADRKPCPVCGHPTGDCVGQTPYPDSIVFHGMPAKHEDRVHEQGFIVEEDVWGYRQITPFTTAKVLLVAKGTSIPLSEARDLGLIEDGSA